MYGGDDFYSLDNNEDDLDYQSPTRSVVLTKKQIMEEAIKVASENGWKLGREWKDGSDLSFISSDDFAKAFWKELTIEIVTIENCGGSIQIPGRRLDWRWHQKQMSKEEEPLEYLRLFLKERYE